MVDKSCGISEIIHYKWILNKEEKPVSQNTKLQTIYWVIIRDTETNTLEITLANYDEINNNWIVLENEEVIAWMPFHKFQPKIPKSIGELN